MGASNLETIGLLKQAQQERDRAQQERDKAFAKLRELGIDPTVLVTPRIKRTLAITLG